MERERERERESCDRDYLLVSEVCWSLIRQQSESKAVAVAVADRK